MQCVKVLGGVVGAAALLGLGIILGHFAIPKGTDSPAPSVSVPQDLDLELLETVMGQLDASRIRENLRELSKEPHLATTPRDEALVQLLLQRWQDPESGLDSAGTSEYEVLLSFPSQEQPNHVDVVGPTGDIIHSCRRSEENLTGEQGGPNVVPPYAAYAPPGSPQGLLVYANQGTEEDFMWLSNQGIQLQDTIVLTRYGGIGRGAKAVNAAQHGAAGLLVYTDPGDINDGKSLPNETFPHSWGLPPSGVERGSYFEYFGDPLTPYLPANPSSFRLDPANVSGFPPIPTQPIGFEDAKVLLCQVNMSIYNRLELRNSSNVLGIIRGAVEPGTWRPRRSVVFASWGAEEFGLIGSTEFTEEFFSKLQERTVAYINVDISVFANVTLRAQGTPPVQSVIFSATKQIPAPGTSSLSIYDNWIRYSNRSSPVYGLVPSLGTLGAGSDYAPFVHFLGISSMDLAYNYDRSKTSARIYPTYHTAFDTFDYVDKFVDPGFSSHQAVARTAGSVLLRLSDSLFLPLNVSDYSETLRSFLQAAQQHLGALLKQHSISLGPLATAVEKFEGAATVLDQHISTTQKGTPDPLQVRMLNDQLMLLERTFLNSRAFPEESYYRATNTGAGSAAWAEVQRQLSILVAALENAAATLRPVADL
ncbi:N-acetylated-alpha-linked acidic dipeptidase-like protein [Camelus ferus]|nr:N-acetylated-alpha-linked acidic dipeptidase-like protein [Camelus ferus]